MRENRIMKRRDKALFAVLKVAGCAYYVLSVAVVVVSVILDYPKPFALWFLTSIALFAWYIICDKHHYCREATLTTLSAVFFFLGCLLKAPFWILCKGFIGAGELFISRLRRFIKLESYRYKKHS